MLLHVVATVCIIWNSEDQAGVCSPDGAVVQFPADAQVGRLACKAYGARFRYPDCCE